MMRGLQTKGLDDERTTDLFSFMQLFILGVQKRGWLQWKINKTKQNKKMIDHFNSGNMLVTPTRSYYRKLDCIILNVFMHIHVH